MGDLDSLIPKMKIPEYIFGPSQAAADSCVEPPECPVLVFINVKSGGQLGSDLLKSYRKVLNPQQVIDLSEAQPDDVLHSFLSKCEKLKEDGDKVAESILNSFKIIVAGGDGTAGWLLGVVGDLHLSRVPPVATVPLGEKKSWHRCGVCKKFLFEVYHATPMNVDSWHVIMKMKTSSDSVEPVKLPHSLHRFSKVSEEDHIHEPGTVTYRGGFWNYFSMGMDAQVSYEFHQKRQQHPELFKNQIINQGAYAMIGVTQGWFLANCTHPTSRNINQLGAIQIKAKGCHHWQKLTISRSIRSIVMLNLPSFSGGLNPWGDPKKKDLTPAYVDDKLIEIVGFRDGWHGLVLLAPNGHGTRLAQAHKVRIEFESGAAKETYMRLDGEPWLQPLPTDPHSKTVVEIRPHGQVVMLTTGNCIAKPTPDNLSGGVQWGEDESCSPAFSVENSEPIEPLDSDTSSDEESSEAKRKFGAAHTFKMSS